MKKPNLKFHEKRCENCRYYRVGKTVTDCLLLGRTLSIKSNSYADYARYCDGWKRRPFLWDIYTTKNPFFEDKYISRKTQQNLRKWGNR